MILFIGGVTQAAVCAILAAAAAAGITSFAAPDGRKDNQSDNESQCGQNDYISHIGLLYFLLCFSGSLYPFLKMRYTSVTNATAAITVNTLKLASPVKSPAI